jgi:hypothetical protein
VPPESGEVANYLPHEQGYEYCGDELDHGPHQGDNSGVAQLELDGVVMII